MKSGPFISLVSSIYGVEERTVTVFARFLKEAGLMSSGARGVNAPRMLPLDAARITIALLSTDRPAQAVQRVQQVGQFRIRQKASDGNLDVPLLRGQDITLEKVLTRHFAAGMADIMTAGHMAYAVDIDENSSGGSASVSYGDGKAYFVGPPDPRPVYARTWRDSGDVGWISHRRSLSAGLLLLQDAMLCDRYQGKDDQGRPVNVEDESIMLLPEEERTERWREIDAYFSRIDPEWRKGTE